MTRYSKDKDTFISGFTKQGVQFSALTPPSSSYVGDPSYFNSNFFLRFVTLPLLWDMEEMYGATKAPHRYLGVVGIIELDDFIQEFGN